MPKYLFTNIAGSFIFDENNKLIDKVIFNNITQYKNRSSTEKKLKEKYKAQEPDLSKTLKFLEYIKNPKIIQKLSEHNLQLTKQKIKESVNEDNLICQATNSIRESEKIINTLVKRLREWYSLYNPEFSESIANNEKFVELILKKSKKDLLRELKISYSMGSDLEDSDLHAITALARQAEALYSYKEHTTHYLSGLMKIYCPNFAELAGITIAAKLIEHTGSLKKLAILPASTIQVLGAEKALFRHIRTGSRPPKYGLIHEHQFIQSAKKSEQGKRARALADKLSIAVRVDYFKGKPIAAKLKKELEEKFR